MRQLDENEKDYCMRILQGNGRNNYLGNVIDHKLQGVRISITRNPPHVELLFTIQNPLPTQQEQEWAIEKVAEISLEILTIVNLITLLEKEGYIMLLQRAHQVPNRSMFGRGVGNLPFITSVFADAKISQLLIEYEDKEIYITAEFVRFCQHNFIARDEQRYRRQIFITTCALVIATCALVLNTLFNLGFLPKFASPMTHASDSPPNAQAHEKDSNLNESLKNINLFHATEEKNYNSIPTRDDLVVIDYPHYSVGYSEKHKIPIWTYYELTAEESLHSIFDREGKTFKADGEHNILQATNADYAGKGFDKGHMVPCESMTYDCNAMLETFFLYKLRTSNK